MPSQSLYSSRLFPDLVLPCSYLDIQGIFAKRLCVTAVFGIMIRVGRAKIANFPVNISISRETGATQRRCREQSCADKKSMRKWS